MRIQEYMMLNYYKDLMPYDGFGVEQPKMLNIGWLNNENSFPTGYVEPVLLDKLFVLTCDSLNKEDEIKYPHINIISTVVRCMVCCPFCKRQITLECPEYSRVRHLGMSELSIPRSDKKILFCFPDLLCHYIEDHNYLPPDEFLQSLNDFSLSEKFDIDTEEGKYWQ